jgi:small subunit ribosomal protein S18
MKKNYDKQDDKGGYDKKNSSGASSGGGFGKKRGCRFCGEAAAVLDYKDKFLMNNFVTERFKIIPRRITGLCAAHQRAMTIEIKKSRHIAILPYTTAQW